MRIGVFVGTVALLVVVACTERKPEPVGSSSTTATSAESKGVPVASPGARDAGAEASSTAPIVPPLLPGEVPPLKGPNYFEPNEMGTTGIASAYQSCLESLDKSSKEVPTWKAVPYCSCIVDAWRANIHNAPSPDTAPMPSKEQMKKCGDLDGGAGPYAVAFPKDSPDLYNAWKDCITKSGGVDNGVYCGCHVDGVFKVPTWLKITPADDARCQIADRYWAATKTHLTVRQFRLLGTPYWEETGDAGAAPDPAAHH